MFEGLLQPTHLILVLVVALVVLGPKRLPEAGKSLGASLRGFKESLAASDAPEAPVELSQPVAPQPASID
jgi:sec-independent protein translocase protein TatA